VATQPATTPGVLRFGDDFELDVRAFELRSAGIPLKLKPIPTELLIFLVERRGELVTREQIVERIWGKGIFLDTDNSINGAISKIRQVLREDAQQPRFVQTVTGRGYRFIAAVSESPTNATPEITAQLPVTEGLIGNRVSHYRILALLGGGGMGVVYKAEDLKLGRRVAIKFLPSELAQDPRAFHRLEREARAASALDHRNICSIYELDEHEGQPFMVMQLLEGETLQEKLEAANQQQKPLPLSTVVDLGIQVTEGLSVAHQKGIIHRDIKPANIFVTVSNEAKILDFGLAKGIGEDIAERDELEASEGNRAVSMRSADSLRLTLTGLHMGTAFYMSPEQVRGEKLDARTDIFSFGLVLYQMLSGQRAFPGNTTAVVHDGILHNEPAPLREINPGLSPRLVAIVDKCLEKDRERRFQSALELQHALQDFRQTVAEEPSSARSKKTFAAALGLVLVMAGIVAFFSWRRPMTQTALQRYRMTSLTSSGNVAFATLSPDGRYMAYADGGFGHQSLWVQQLATSSTVRILEPVSHPLLEGLRFTPDGNYLYYIQEDPNAATQSLYRVPALGGPPQRIVFDIGDFSAVDVSPDGKQIVYSRGGGNSPDGSHTETYLLVANADGSGERRILTLSAGEAIGIPVWSPDGQHIAFGFSERADTPSGVAVVSSHGGSERRILRGARWLSRIAWLPDQSGLVLSMWPLRAENFSLWTASYPDGRLRKITSDLANYYDLSFAHDGRSLVTVQRQRDSTLWVAPASDPSQAIPLREGAAREDGMWGVDWLADGRLVYGIGDLSELWLADRDGSRRQQLTQVGKTATNPSVSADGGTIVFARMDYSTRTTNIWAVDANGENLRQITNGPNSKWHPEISPDGRWLVYGCNGVYKLSFADGKTTKLETKWGGDPTISPDGRWIAFEAWDDHIEVLPAEGQGAPRYLPFISEPQAPNPVADYAASFPLNWTPSSDALTYVRTRDGISNLWMQPLDGSPAKQLTHFTSMYIWRHAWSRDGKYLVMARGNLSRDAVMLTDVR